MAPRPAPLRLRRIPSAVTESQAFIRTVQRRVHTPRTGLPPPARHLEIPNTADYEPLQDSAAAGAYPSTSTSIASAQSERKRRHPTYYRVGRGPRKLGSKGVLLNLFRNSSAHTMILFCPEAC
ncbi:hypothetical protein EXIGLDRAFT_766323 [Exidia glandulosa HHB12029]|uniref:Uncharacterized protein n=1 Tax=Exidia glandulosa HHB12029 TaxID=1314781 RepID=A0A165JTJ9_EXIGL|nr:hypothetical protein EXIGLDRAFT_766323 [Exidia glandulosa HHB12029]